MDIVGFLRGMDLKMSCKYLTWISKLNEYIEQNRMKELLQYATAYFQRYPQTFEWYKSI